MLKAINIKWDTDGDTEVLNNLPKEMIIPDYLEEYYCFDKNNKYATEEILTGSLMKLDSVIMNLKLLRKTQQNQ